MALDAEVGLSPGHFVPDGDPAPLPQKGAEPPIFGPSLLWPNGWMHQDITWYDEGINDTVPRACQTAANAQQAQNRHMEDPQYAAAWKSSTTR